MSVASAATKLVLRLELAVAWTSFCFVRMGERLLPTSVVSLLLWPPAAAWDLLHLRRRKPVAGWRRFPKSWQPKRWRFYLRQSLGLYHAQFLYLWPDRLRTSRWQSRCRFEGESNLIAAGEEKRAVVLASLHFGPFEVLPYWLRAHGIVTTSVRADPPESLKSLTSYQYSLSPPADVPVFLLTSEMTPLPRFSHIRQLLGPGRRLLVMVDVNRGPQFHLPFENRSFRMASGAIQLAMLANAELIPCLIAETASWKFAVYFGTPVPRHYLGKSPDMQAIGAHLLTQFSKVVSRYPEQCKPRLLSAMSPLPVNGAPDLSAIAHPAKGH